MFDKINGKYKVNFTHEFNPPRCEIRSKHIKCHGYTVIVSLAMHSMWIIRKHASQHKYSQRLLNNSDVMYQNVTVRKVLVSKKY